MRLVFDSLPRLVAEKSLHDSIGAMLPDWPWLIELWNQGDTLWRVAALFSIVLVSLIVGWISKEILAKCSRIAQQRGRKMRSAIWASLARTASFVSFVLGLSYGMPFIQAPPPVMSIISAITHILGIIAWCFVAYALVDVISEWLRVLATKNVSRLDQMLSSLITKSLRGTIVILALVQVATVLSDKPVPSILASLGVGGLAIGLAAQDTIKNFFGSLMIFGDRPFELGDTIQVDGREGKVEVVGLRSTRFRTAEGYLVTMPNGDLASKLIINISKRKSLMRKITLALRPDQPAEKITAAVRLAREILAARAELNAAQPPQVSFSDITPASLLLTIQYWHEPPQAPQFTACNEWVNFELLERFTAAGIRFAAPPFPPASP